MTGRGGNVSGHRPAHPSVAVWDHAASALTWSRSVALDTRPDAVELACETLCFGLIE